MTTPATQLRAALVADASIELEAAGVPSPRHDAEALAAHVLGVRPGRLASAAFDGEQATRYRALVARRAAREPLQYLVGHAPFRRLEIEVGPGTFIPRPETEVMVGWLVAALARGEPTQAQPLIVDLCSGPGTVALSLAQEVPTARVHAVESEPAALAWAERNVRALGFDVVVHAADAASALPDLDGEVDAVIANPPYLTPSLSSVLDPEVVEHEPHEALFAPDGGLAVIRVIVSTAQRLLRAGGVLAVEHGDDQGAEVVRIVRDSGGFGNVKDHPDLAGRDRFTTATRLP